MKMVERRGGKGVEGQGLLGGRVHWCVDGENRCWGGITESDSKGGIQGKSVPPHSLYFLPREEKLLVKNFSSSPAPVLTVYYREVWPRGSLAWNVPLAGRHHELSNPGEVKSPP